jgi:hypothetical protein
MNSSLQHLYAVVDTARDGRLYDLVHDLPGSVCLFAGEMAAPLRHSSPYLVPLDQAEALLEKWRSIGRGASWGMFLRSSQEPAWIRRRLRTFNLAKLPGGRTVLFRWWDPRVFRTYIPTCGPEDVENWFSGIQEIICESAEGLEFEAFRGVEGKLVRERVGEIIGL